MRVLVTGSTGFLGSYFCSNVTRLSLCTLDSSIRMNDLSGSLVSFQKELNNSDTVLHLAGLAHGNFTDQQLNEVNHLGTLKLARLAAKAGVKRFVFVSTVNVHGGSSFDLPLTESTSLDASIDVPKSLAEAGLQKIGRETGMEVTIVRPVLVYGKGVPGNMGLLVKIASKLSFTPLGLVKNNRSFISVSNLCDFLYTCCIHPKAANEAFLVSDDQTVSVPVFMSAIAKGLGKKIYHLPIPVWVMHFLGTLSGKSKQVEQLVGDLEVDCSKAQKLLGWTPPEKMAQATTNLNNG
jgi:nucleoside-diphosphate-sugar epimerase